MKFALGVEYQGTGYCGFQKQPGLPAVQTELEKALSVIADEPVEVVCAGRTDRGVNATGQVIHIEVSNERRDDAFVVGANNYLPPDIAITWACRTDESFHARFSATSRRYRYIIRNTRARAAILNDGLSIYHADYDVPLMHECAQILLGEQDFSSFCSADEQSESRMRCVQDVRMDRIGEYIVFDISANAFLNHMVRNIVGSLLLVGSGKKDREWFASVFGARDREAAGPTAHPEGLYLVNVIYPDSFGLPKRDFLGPLWLR